MHTSFFISECPYGSWGDNCESECGSCLNGTCNITDGSCSTGCNQGFKNTSHCTDGTFMLFLFNQLRNPDLVCNSIIATVKVN